MRWRALTYLWPGMVAGIGLGALMFVGVLGVVAVHGGYRFYSAAKSPRPKPELQKVYMYTVYERFWHWTQTFVIVLLLVLFSVGAMAGSSWFLKGRDFATLQRGATGLARRRLSPWQTAFAYFWIALALLLVLSPHIGVLLLSLSKVWSYSLVPEIYTLDNYRTILADSTRMIGNTLVYCGLAALIDVIIGTAIAYLVLRTRLPGRQFLDHRYPQRCRHRHQHGPQPTIRPAAEQSRRRSRCRGDSVCRKKSRHQHRRSATPAYEGIRPQRNQRRFKRCS